LFKLCCMKYAVLILPHFSLGKFSGSKCCKHYDVEGCMASSLR
jgi:hypothetical protein